MSMNNEWAPRTEREREAVVHLGCKAFARWRGSISVSFADAMNEVVPPVPPPAPPTRLREYKGVTYDATMNVWQWAPRDGGPSYFGASAARVIAHREADGFTDADHAALLDLKKNPTEPAPDRVVEAIKAAVVQTNGDYETVTEALATTIRAIVREEVAAEVPTLTVAQHVDALVKMGAKKEMRFKNASFTSNEKVPALILPTDGAA
jgi:hypothetical protein